MSDTQHETAFQSSSPAALIVRLAKLIKDLNLSKTQASAIIGVTIQTLGNWFASRRSPSPRTVENAIRRIESHPLTQAKLEETHHLHLEPSRGWVLRFTLELNRKLVGKRRKIRLRTFSLEEAITRREILVGEYKRLGFTVSDRRQRKRNAGRVAPAP